jgi:uncharacterized membrane protein YjgN (DUF898 family)
VAEPVGNTRIEGDSFPTTDAIDVSFTGRTGEYFQIWLVNTALTLATCGLYMPWARVRTRRYFLGQTRLQDSGFDYQANPWALFLGWILIGIGFSLLSSGGDLLTLGLTATIKRLVKELWVVPVLTAAMGLLLLVIQLVAVSWLMVQSLRYNASRIQYRNLRFGFGSFEARFRLWRELLALFCLRLLVPLSLGLLQPYSAWRWRRFLIRHRRFGTTPFAFTATAADFLRLHGRALPLLLAATALPLLALGWLARGSTQAIASSWPILIPAVLASLPLVLLWSCWLEARAAALTWRSTQLGELRFACRWRARDLLGLRLLHGLVLVLSLGLAWPWVRIQASRYRLRRIGISPAAALHGFLAAEEERISALAEGGFALDDALSGLIDVSL